MNSHQRRKHKRSVDRLYKSAIGYSYAEFMEGRISSKTVCLNGSAASAKTWSSKTPQQILEDINELLNAAYEPKVDRHSINYELSVMMLNSTYGKFARPSPHQIVTGIEGV